MSVAYNYLPPRAFSTQAQRARYIGRRTGLRGVHVRKFLQGVHPETRGLDRAVGRTVRLVDRIADDDSLTSTDAKALIARICTGIKKSILRARNSIRDGIEALADALLLVADLLSFFGSLLVDAVQQTVSLLRAQFT